MKFSIAICTWNRADMLDLALAELERLRLPEGHDWEIVLVNNNCTDHTDAVVARRQGSLPIRSVVETRQGVANARNRAVAEAKGDYVLWIDDDMLADPDWLAEYAAAFQRWPEATLLGGTISPWFEGTPPRWLQRIWRRVSSAFAIREFGDDVAPLSETNLPYGNWAARTSELRRYPYNPHLGRNAGSLLGGEEVDVILRLLSDGAKGYWIPQARVRHLVPKSRQTVDYLRAYFRGLGESQGREAPLPPAATLFGHPRWLLRKAVQAELRYRFQRVCCRPETWIESLIVASSHWGRLTGNKWKGA